MAILLTSSNPLGLRAVGSGGRTAISSYDQIKRTLKRDLGPEHSALFSEPSQRTATIIDWYTELDAKERPIRLIEAPLDVQYRGLDRLETLVRDIEARAVSLERSDRQDERILGEMIRQSLDIPDEEAVYMVGEQPVMTFWGYVKDKGQPALSPIHSLLRRRPPKQPNERDVAARAEGEDGGGASAPPKSRDATPQSKAARFRGFFVPSWLLWSIFVILLLTCGVQLLRGCALGFPFSVTGWLLDFCPASVSLADARALDDERAQQSQLQAEFEDLVGQAALKRQACLIAPGKPGLPPRSGTKPPKRTDAGAPPVDPSKPIGDETAPKQQLKIPPKKDDKIDFLEGCWRAHEGLTETVGGKDTGKKLITTYCFQKDGSGFRTIRYEEDGALCKGPLKAARNGDTLNITLSVASCAGNHGSFVAGVDTCRSSDQGAALCDEVTAGDTKPDFSNFPFTRTEEQP